MYQNPIWVKKCRQLGARTVDHLKNRIENLDLETITELTRTTFLQEEKDDARVELTAPERSDLDYELKIYGTSMPESVMTSFAAFYEEIGEKLGYKTIDRKISHGICTLSLKKMA